MSSDWTVRREVSAFEEIISVTSRPETNLQNVRNWSVRLLLHGNISFDLSAARSIDKSQLCRFQTRIRTDDATVLEVVVDICKKIRVFEGQVSRLNKCLDRVRTAHGCTCRVEIKYPIQT